MALKLYFHPFSSFCQKVLIALYENGTPFERELVDLMDPASAAAFRRIWPIGKFPVLRDEGRGETVPESSIIIEYLAEHYPGKSKLVPDNPDLAREARFYDRFFDLYVEMPLQKVVVDRFRPEGKNDPYGVEQAKSQFKTALDIIEDKLTGKTWATGESFTMADCAAAPALFYANLAMPFDQEYKQTAAYLRRLIQRPSFARCIEEAKPYRHFFPIRNADWSFAEADSSFAA
ncbi:glutathione S-transferase family protein [Methyloceanibacter sp.]|uniref:glutathione S-transferase family protein n=1 Tax=Methyloceanibacter sp. TaxID=1965321 RepID=UPI002D74179C|nr:glutathione S-transferase family protein [Methyloceanibacter sp.]HZP09226.1 glutathione S-transferase family protein [Methyloceanibacter sp.]